MRRNNTHSDDYKAEEAARLLTLIEKSGITKARIRHILLEKYGYNISRQTFHKYIHGENWMPDDFINYVAEILNVPRSDIAKGVKE